jgi:hypothetical protein
MEVGNLIFNYSGVFVLDKIYWKSEVGERVEFGSRMANSGR